MDENTPTAAAEAVDSQPVPETILLEEAPGPETPVAEATRALDEPLPQASEPVVRTPETRQPAETAPEAEWMAQIKLLHKRFGEQERLSAERERVIDRLHEENQRLKQGELLKHMVPVYRDLMRLYDDLEKTANEYAARDEITVQKTAEDWRFFAVSVTDLLYRYGVDAIAIEPGQPFDAKSHRAAAVKKTAEPDREKTVARVISAGFVSDGRILRPAAIEVFRYEKPAFAEPETELNTEAIQGEATHV